MEELWKYYDETHKVSNLGRVMCSNGKGKGWHEQVRILRDGHLYVIIKHKRVALKKLVACLFVPNPHNFHHVCNKDGNYLNCNADNLEWSPGKFVKHVSKHRTHKSWFTKEEVIHRIKEKHGDKYTLLSEYKNVTSVSLFKCNECGNEFETTIQKLYTLSNPCPCCNYRKEQERNRKKEHKHAKLIEQRKGSKRVIYLYDFGDGYAYVGLALTYRKRKRDREHRRMGPVYKHSKETGIPVPPVKYLEENLTADEASVQEGVWKDRYAQTHKMLNVAPTGGLGGGPSRHTLDEAIDVRDKVKFRKQLPWWAYQLLKKHDMLPPAHNEWMTLEKAREMKAVYKTRKELKTHCIWAYNRLKEAGELPAKVKTKIRIVVHTLEEALEVLKKRPTRDMLHKCKWAWNILEEHGLLPEPRKRKPDVHTLEEAISLRDELKTRSALSLHKWAYELLKERGLLPRRDYSNHHRNGRPPKWRTKRYRTSAELTIQWG